MKILVITSCTGLKLYNPPNKLTQQDFLNTDTLRKREVDLQEYSCKSINMYKGQQHILLVQGIDILRYKLKNNCIDINILSAGYGLLKEDTSIVPYEVTFNSMSNKELKEWSTFLDINNSVSQAIKDYDVVFFLLGTKYLKSLQLPLEIINPEQKLIFLAGRSCKHMIPDKHPYYLIELCQEDATSFSYGLVGLKGYLMKLLFNDIALDGIQVFDEIYKDPNIIMNMLNKYRK